MAIEQSFASSSAAVDDVRQVDRMSIGELRINKTELSLPSP
jgi:hypothetical protein